MDPEPSSTTTYNPYTPEERREMERQGLTRRAIAARIRWSAPREYYAAGHQIHEVWPSNRPGQKFFTVRTLGKDKKPLGLAFGPLFTTLGALRAAIYRGSIPDLAPPAKPRRKRGSPSARLASARNLTLRCPLVTIARFQSLARQAQKQPHEMLHAALAAWEYLEAGRKSRPPEKPGDWLG